MQIRVSVTEPVAECTAGAQYRPGNSGPQVTSDALTKSERLCALADIPDGGAHEVVTRIDGAPESLILLRRGTETRAFFNVCPHAGRRLDWAPGRFLIDQTHLVCSAHGASFEIPGGLCVAGPCRGQQLGEVGITVRDGDVFLR
jgi:nitrite reductase/ring-hydroxylating ferredoxin subunit